MRYLSVCSGIEAVSCAWESLGLEPAGFAEIGPFASAVLAHRFPGVKNHGDFTQLDARPGDFDILVGGTPCQSFSVAGLRGGIEDARGNLALEFFRLAARAKPKWIVWENVPGVLSSGKGRDFGAILDAINDAGYAVECDILDAQCFGVPQRRRRVFCLGHNVRRGQEERTKLFGVTATQLLTDCLLSVLAAHSDLFSTEGKKLAWPSKYSSVGLQRRMKLFALPTKLQEEARITPAAWLNLRADWVAAILKFQLEPNLLDCPLSLSSSGSRFLEDGESSRKEALEFLSIDRLWKDFLAGVYAAMSASTTSTESSSITEQTIYSCAVLALNICRFTCSSIASAPSLWNEESSGLTALKGFMNYARRTSKSVSGGLAGVLDWGGFIESAERVQCELTYHLGDWRRAAAVLFEPESLRRDSTKGCKAREEIAGTPGGGSGSRGWSSDTERMTFVPAVSPALKARDYKGPSSDGDGDGAPLVAHTLRGGPGFAAGEDGTGRGVPLIPVAFDPVQITHPENRSRLAPGKACHTLSKENVSRASVFFSVVPEGGQGADLRATEIDVVPAITVTEFQKKTDRGVRVVQQLGVRRLTPVECERLQGFPDNWTNVPYRGKPAKDGPRYAAIGNSMAVPVMRWIGERVIRVENTP